MISIFALTWGSFDPALNNPAKVLKCSLIIAELIKSRFRNAKEEIRKDSILTGILWEN